MAVWRAGLAAQKQWQTCPGRLGHVTKKGNLPFDHAVLGHVTHGPVGNQVGLCRSNGKCQGPIQGLGLAVL